MTDIKIIHDQINNSPSKQFYSIPKETRFKKNKGSYCSTASYELPSSINQRSPGFGYGNKLDFTKKQFNTPGANKYDLLSVFDKNKEKSKGSSIGLGRELVKFMTIIPKVYPGPGTYDPKQQNVKLKYSLGSRTDNPMLFTTAKFNPGPGAYNIKGTNSTGYYFDAKLKGQQATIINPPTSKRFRLRLSMTPGAGSYDLESINKHGKYANSRNINPLGGKWSTGDRFYIPKQKLQVPPPGNYRIVSEFGDTDFPPIQRTAKSTRKKMNSFENEQKSKEILNTENNVNYKQQKPTSPTMETEQAKNE